MNESGEKPGDPAKNEFDHNLNPEFSTGFARAYVAGASAVKPSSLLSIFPPPDREIAWEETAPNVTAKIIKNCLNTYGPNSMVVMNISSVGVVQMPELQSQFSN